MYLVLSYDSNPPRDIVKSGRKLQLRSSNCNYRWRG